jgi:dephospho-CoA kinase
VIAREVVAKGAPALAEIRESFGDDVFDSEGLLDRKRMRQVVFADETQRRKLEGILHPRIRAETVARAAAVSYPYMVIVVPLLVESPMKEFMDRVLVVDCSEDTQLSRLIARDAENEAQARRMMASQSSRDARLRIADDVVQNDGDLDETRRTIQALHQEYLELGREIRP